MLKRDNKNRESLKGTSHVFLKHNSKKKKSFSNIFFRFSLKVCYYNLEKIYFWQKWPPIPLRLKRLILTSGRSLRMTPSPLPTVSSARITLPTLTTTWGRAFIVAVLFIGNIYGLSSYTVCKKVVWPLRRVKLTIVQCTCRDLRQRPSN